MELFFLLVSMLLLLSSADQTRAEVRLSVTNTATSTPGGVRFEREIGTQYTLQTLSAANSFIWQILRQGEADRKRLGSVEIFINDIDDIASTSGNQINISARYIQRFNGDIRKEIRGVVYHEDTHVWQWEGKDPSSPGPEWVLEGMADYVRLKAGLVPSYWRKPSEGKRWDDGSDVTAYFFDYCNGLKDGFIADLNRKVKAGYSDGFFQETLGKTLDQLWADYRATLKA